MGARKAVTLEAGLSNNLSPDNTPMRYGMSRIGNGVNIQWNVKDEFFNCGNSHIVKLKYQRQPTVVFEGQFDVVFYNYLKNASCNPPSTAMIWPVVLLRRWETSRK